MESHPPVPESPRRLDHTDLVLVVTLIAIRLIEAGLRLVTMPDPPQWVYHAYYGATYLTTAIFIYRHRTDLAAFHITRFALALFLSAPLASPLLQLLLNEPLLVPPFRFSWDMLLDPPTIAIALGLTLVLRRHQPWPTTSGDRPAHLLLALLAGFGITFLLETLYARINPPHPGMTKTDLTAAIAVTMFVSQIAWAAAMEEPAFRGILWGYLRQRAWPETSILLVQAILFWIAHIYHTVRYPLSFWVGVPVLAVAFGYTAWRTRSIGASMLMHAAANTEGWFYGAIRL